MCTCAMKRTEAQMLKRCGKVHSTPLDGKVLKEYTLYSTISKILQTSVT